MSKFKSGRMWRVRVALRLVKSLGPVARHGLKTWAVVGAWEWRPIEELLHLSWWSSLEVAGLASLLTLVSFGMVLCFVASRWTGEVAS